MKELSIEEKAKAYNIVREKIAIRFGSNVADEIFSQFEMSEDERIRKELIGHLKECRHNTRSEVMIGEYAKWIAWLEKQGEQKPANKVEPKFKAGDVLADGNLPFIFKNIDTNRYSYAYCGISVDGGFKIESDGEFGEWTWAQDIKPATKEQCDLLFQKMKEAGYEWDAENKELKKIEQKPIDKYKEWYDFIRWFVKQRTDDYNLIPSRDDIHKWGDDILNHAIKVLEQNTTAWSEEDEKMFEHIIAKATLHFSSINYLDEEEINFLKSLRPQNRWKPSEEQIKVCKEVYADILSAKGFDLGTINSELNRLEEDLKKLKG